MDFLLQEINYALCAPRGAETERGESMNSKKRNALMCLSIAILAVLISFLIACEIGAAQIPVRILVINAMQILATGLCCATVFLLAFWAFELWTKRPSYGAAETRFRLFVFNRRKTLALRNAAQIAPALQYFLYTVLRRNKSTLGIDPGPDCGSLSPNGRAVAFRNNTLYYVMELVAPTSPEMEIDTLRKLINQFAFSELTNYGTVNLPSYFITNRGKAYPSVYLDRLSYDDVHHVLVFELLFVCSDQAVAALEKAWERDRPQAAKAEPEVFDDDV